MFNHLLSQLKPLVVCLACSLSLSYSFAGTCKGALSTELRSGQYLSELKERLYDFSNLYEGIDLLRSAVPRTSRNPYVSLPFESVDPNDGRSPYSFGFNMHVGQSAVNKLSPYIKWGPYSEGRFVEPFITGEDVEDLIISVHSYQSTIGDYIFRPKAFNWHLVRRGFVDHLKRDFFSREEFSEVPRLFLVNKDYRIKDVDFLQEASVLYYSQGGGVAGKIPVARNYHLVGEQFKACMKISIEQIIEFVLDANTNKTSNIILHSNHILNVNGNGMNEETVTRLFPLSETLEGASKEEVLRRVLGYGTESSLRHSPYEVSYDNQSECLVLFNPVTESLVNVCFE